MANGPLSTGLLRGANILQASQQQGLQRQQLEQRQSEANWKKNMDILQSLTAAGASDETLTDYIHKNIAPEADGQLDDFTFEGRGKEVANFLTKSFTGFDKQQGGHGNKQRYLQTLQQGLSLYPKRGKGIEAEIKRVTEPTLEEKVTEAGAIAKAKRGVTPLNEFQTIAVASGVPRERVLAGEINQADAEKILQRKEELQATTDVPTKMSLIFAAEGIDPTQKLEKAQAERVIKRYTKEFGADSLINMLLGGSISTTPQPTAVGGLTADQKKRKEELEGKLKQ